MKFKTTIPDQPTLGVTAVSGASSVAGKTSMPESVMTDAPKPKAETVKEAPEEKGAARKCIDTQVGQNGNPKKRDANHWGIGACASEDAKELK